MAIILNDSIGNTGGGGTTDYTDLNNKPSINSVTLSGNKTSADLNLVPAPTVVTDGDNTGLAVEANKIYKWTNALTSLSFSSVEVSDLETVLYFTTGAGTISLSAPNTLRWGGGNEQPTLEPNTVYCIAIRNGLAEIDNFGSAS